MNDFEETIDLNKAFETSMAIDVGHHPFATMEENPDFKKTKVLQGIPAAEFRRAEARRRWALLYKSWNECINSFLWNFKTLLKCPFKVFDAFFLFSP